MSPTSRTAETGGHVNPIPRCLSADTSEKEFPDAENLARLVPWTSKLEGYRHNSLVTADPDERSMHEEGLGMIIRQQEPARQQIVLARLPLHQRSPFIPEVSAYPIPPGFKLPKIKTYDGTGDPSEHVRKFAIMMRLSGAPDTLLCQAFPATLEGQALAWFFSLKDAKIENFAELEQQFTDHFLASKRTVKDPSHLSGIRQGEGETLRDFYRRFTTEAQQVPGVSPEILRSFLLGGLRPGNFYSALIKEAVPSYHDLIRHIEAQIILDDAVEAHQKQFGKSKKRLREHRDPIISGKSGDRRIGSRPLQHRRYTPLNTARASILRAVQGSKVLRKPRPLAKNVGDQSKYCEFHQGRGHGTEDCTKLKDGIELLVKRGLLKEYLQNSASNGPIKGRPSSRQEKTRDRP